MNTRLLGKRWNRSFGYGSDGLDEAATYGAKHERPEIEGRSERASRQLRVLVVEDDTDMRWAVRDVLMMRGHLVNTAQTGTAGAALAADDDYDVVITDIRLPGMSGIELARNIQQGKRPPEIIVITAYPEWFKEAQFTGVKRVLRKPLNLALLANIVEQAAAERTDLG